MPNKHIGGDFDSFLEQENILVESEALALKRIIAFALKKAMKENNISKAETARRMHTSRMAFDRLLDPSPCLNRDRTLFNNQFIGIRNSCNLPRNHFHRREIRISIFEGWGPHTDKDRF